MKTCSIGKDKISLYLSHNGEISRVGSSRNLHSVSTLPTFLWKWGRENLLSLLLRVCFHEHQMDSLRRGTRCSSASLGVNVHYSQNGRKKNKLETKQTLNLMALWIIITFSFLTGCVKWHQVSVSQFQAAAHHYHVPLLFSRCQGKGSQGSKVTGKSRRTSWFTPSAWRHQSRETEWRDVRQTHRTGLKGNLGTRRRTKKNRPHSVFPESADR